jgi:hypothetical protein
VGHADRPVESDGNQIGFRPVAVDVNTDSSPTSTPIAVAAPVPAPISRVFAFLADPENHRRLAGSRLDLLDLDDGEQLRGGAILIRGPLLIRRRADTRVASIRAPHLIAGVARLGPQTRAIVSWELDQDTSGCTRVVLTADPCSLSRADRLLLRLGGARWIRTLFAETIERLAAQLTQSPAAAVS